jgi:hypothetical protein
MDLEIDLHSTSESVALVSNIFDVSFAAKSRRYEERAPMIAIEVTALERHDPPAFKVVLTEGKAENQYFVTIADATLERLAPGIKAEACIEAAFRFLLDREPKEAILSRFDITLISRYFPEFEKELPRYLSNS